MESTSLSWKPWSGDRGEGCEEEDRDRLIERGRWERGGVVGMVTCGAVRCGAVRWKWGARMRVGEHGWGGMGWVGRGACGLRSASFGAASPPSAKTADARRGRADLPIFRTVGPRAPRNHK